jgi:L-ascorbate metabolism protein UlaG (beta-lactamase superfamily)
MNTISRRNFAKSAFLLATYHFINHPFMTLAATKQKLPSYRLLRHATLLLEINGKKILTDPMLSNKDALDPIANAPNNTRIPMTSLPINDAELTTLLQEVDAVLVTHTHRDHWDIAARERIPKSKLILCQPADEQKIKDEGFTNVLPIDDHIIWNDITIHRTNGQHGTGEIGKRMGMVSGFVLSHHKHKIYIAGDTIWCSDVEEAITQHQPTHIIVNGGGARFIEGDPITMTVADVLTLAHNTKARIDVVHLETINHCLQKRPDFKKAIKEQNLEKQVYVPADGEWVSIK